MSTHDSDSNPTAEPFDWEAIARYLAGESTPAEAREVRAWLDARPDRAAVVAALGRSFERLAAEDAAADVDVEGALARVHARMAEPALTVDREARSAPVPRFAPRLSATRPLWRRPVGWLAAAAMVAIAAVGVARTRIADPAVRPLAATSYASAVGARDSFRLPDGTRVVLGPGSRLDIDPRYGSQRRDVELEGEAYFDVVHDAARPFIVHAGHAAIEDIGTAFVVRSDGRDSVRVAVTAGRVRLAPEGGDADRAIELAAGESATLGLGGAPVRSPAASDELAFTRGQLVFREAPLTQVAAELRRWYGLELRVDDSTLAKRRLTASFEKETPDQVLAVIGAALGTTVTRQGDFWVVGKAGRGRATGTR